MKHNELNEEYTQRLDKLYADNTIVRHALHLCIVKDIPLEHVLIEVIETFVGQIEQFEELLK